MGLLLMFFGFLFFAEFLFGRGFESIRPGELSFSQLAAGWRFSLALADAGRLRPMVGGLRLLPPDPGTISMVSTLREMHRSRGSAAGSAGASSVGVKQGRLVRRLTVGHCDAAGNLVPGRC